MEKHNSPWSGEHGADADGVPAYDYEENAEDGWGSSFVKPEPKASSDDTSAEQNGATSHQSASHAPQNGYTSNDEDGSDWGYNLPKQRSDRNTNGSSSRRNGNRGSFALALQRACDDAAQTVQTNSVLTNKAWASPLTTAPFAISIMALLLKAADQEAAAGLEVDRQDVLKEGKVVGELPSKYFHTNLQHCADLGRLAFREAQHSMSAITKTARSLINEEGSIGYIIELLEAPEDARHDLKPELVALKEKTAQCLDSAKGIKSKFEYWFLVITTLKENSLSRGGEIILERKRTKEEQTRTRLEEGKYHQEKKSLESQVQTAREKLDEARAERQKALNHYQMLCHSPVQIEPSFWQEIEAVNRLYPNTPPPQKRRGLGTLIKDLAWGQSPEHEREDAEAAQAHWKRIAALREEAMEAAREKRAEDRKKAQAFLDEAKEREDKMTAELRNAERELRDGTNLLAEAESNLSRVEADMKMLENRDAELAEIMKILENSARRLGEMKNLLDPLVTFFDSVQCQIDKVVTTDVQDFLRPIENRLASGNADDEDALRFGRAAKKRITTAALHMQGQFSAISDISSAYVEISSQYIRPAILQMEELSTLKESEWEVKRGRFLRWCKDAVTHIDNIAKETDETVINNVNYHMNALQRRAIEAAVDR